MFIIEKRLLRNEYYISIQNMNILHKTFCEWSIMYDSLIVALDDISYYKTIFCRWRPAHLFVDIGNFILEDKRRLLMTRWCQGVLWLKEKRSMLHLLSAISTHWIIWNEKRPLIQLRKYAMKTYILSKVLSTGHQWSMKKLLRTFSTFRQHNIYQLPEINTQWLL